MKKKVNKLVELHSSCLRRQIDMTTNQEVDLKIERKSQTLDKVYILRNFKNIQA